jgi:hypothetical protein
MGAMQVGGAPATQWPLGSQVWPPVQTGDIRQSGWQTPALQTAPPPMQSASA